jgi:hypothetical protein
MYNLNLPSVSLKFKEINGKKAIFDIVRKKYIILTPEEWVRQHFIHFLINKYQYPRSLIKIESGIRFNDITGRSDIIVYDRKGQVFLLVECKAPTIPLSNVVFEQASRYNQDYKAKYLLITNGLQHFCCEINHQTNSYTYMNDIPTFQS